MGESNKLSNGKIKAFGSYHPIPLMVYFLSVIITAMFIINPVMLITALLGGICFYAKLQRGRIFWSDIAFYIPMFLMIAVTNPLFSHNGVTPLFFLNGNPVTLEAVLYGADIAIMLVAIVYWCKCYSIIMTTDKFLYLFGKAIPKLSLVLSMALRFIPRFKTQIKQISNAQKAMGLYTSESFIDKIRSGCRVFMSIISWSLENSIETGSSMKARGYGLKGRTNFSVFRFTSNDYILLAVSVVLIAATGAGLALKAVDFSFYPRISSVLLQPISIITYISFGILSFLPFMIELKESIKWKCYISKI